jgi:hypothetical protein
MHGEYVHLPYLSSERRMFSVKYDICVQKPATAQTRRLSGDECRKYDISHFARWLQEIRYLALCERNSWRSKCSILHLWVKAKTQFFFVFSEFRLFTNNNNNNKSINNSDMVNNTLKAPEILALLTFPNLFIVNICWPCLTGWQPFVWNWPSLRYPNNLYLKFFLWLLKCILASTSTSSKQVFPSNFPTETFFYTFSPIPCVLHTPTITYSLI